MADLTTTEIRIGRIVEALLTHKVGDTVHFVAGGTTIRAQITIADGWVLCATDDDGLPIADRSYRTTATLDTGALAYRVETLDGTEIDTLRAGRGTGHHPGPVAGTGRLTRRGARSPGPLETVHFLSTQMA